MKKRGLIIGVIILLLWGGLWSAHDCHLFTETSIRNIDDSLFDKATKNDPALSSITKEGLHRALINLKTHCCNARILNDNPEMFSSCKKDELLTKERSNYPESSFLIDHLVDVMMRRLTEKESYQDVPADPIAQQRTQQLNTIATSSEGSIPPALSRTYNDFWSFQVQYLLPKYNGVSASSYRQALQTQETEKASYSNLSSWNLATRYYNLCQNAIYLTSLLPVDFKSEQLTLAQQRCNQLISTTISEETQMFLALIIHKSDLLLEQTLKSYANDYLMKTRKESLIDSLVRTNSNLFGVVRMIPLLVNITN